MKIEIEINEEVYKKVVAELGSRGRIGFSTMPLDSKRELFATIYDNQVKPVESKPLVSKIKLSPDIKALMEVNKQLLDTFVRAEGIRQAIELDNQILSQLGSTQNWKAELTGTAPLVDDKLGVTGAEGIAGNYTGSLMKSGIYNHADIDIMRNQANKATEYFEHNGELLAEKNKLNAEVTELKEQLHYYMGLAQSSANKNIEYEKSVQELCAEIDKLKKVKKAGDPVPYWGFKVKGLPARTSATIMHALRSSQVYEDPKHDIEIAIVRTQSRELIYGQQLVLQDVMTISDND